MNRVIHEFRGQLEQENVLYETRAHIVSLAVRMISHVVTWGVTGIACVIALHGLEILSSNRPFSLWRMVETPWLVSVWCMIVLTGVFYAWVTWYLTLFVVTNRRLITFVQEGLFSQYAIELKFNNIKDTSYIYRTPLHYFFNYGTLIARSSPGAIERFEVASVPNPRDVHNYIHKLIVLAEEAHRKGEKPVLPRFSKKWGMRHLSRQSRIDTASAPDEHDSGTDDMSVV